MSWHVYLLQVKYQLILGFAYRRAGQGNNSCRGAAVCVNVQIIAPPLSDVSARIPLASKIEAYFGFCVPTHRTKERHKAPP